MKKGSVVKTPDNSSFIKTMKDYNNNPYYSFLWNKSEKNKENGEWEIVERYLINVMNLQLEGGMEISITEILESKPKIMKDKKGKDYLNCVIFCNAEIVTKQETTSNDFSVDDEYGEDEDDLPF